MQHKHETSPERIEAVAKDGEIDLALSGGATNIDQSSEIDAPHVRQAIESEGIRQLLVEQFDGFAVLSDQVGGYTSDEWLADTPNRIQEGTADSLREDVVYQSTDWEEATGKRDNPIADLIGS